LRAGPLTVPLEGCGSVFISYRREELITRRLLLEQINDGFAGMAKRAVVRAVPTLS
jgi:hypothetical protein